MASSQQSAQEFLKNGRDLLIEGRLHCGPIIKSLNQCSVISHELNSIKSAKNNKDKLKIMLDIVISKGEEACYTFLKILCDKRFQAFPRPGFTSTDLHHWISCFSFQEDPKSLTANNGDLDPCSPYQDHLRLKAKEALDEKWRQSIFFFKKEQKSLKFIYLPLVVDTESSTVSKLKKNKGCKKSRSKKLKKYYISTDKKMLSPKDLIMNEEKSILLVGKPGVGKTTVALEILRLWTKEKHFPMSYIFYFDEPRIRLFSQSTKPQTLKNLLFQNDSPTDEASDQVLENIEENSENVVLIFDGIMDVIENSVIHMLLEKKLLKDAKILTTCRPEAEEAGYLSDWQSYRVEVRGFNEKSICEYFKRVLGTTDGIGVLENPELVSLCSVPLYAFIVSVCISASPAEKRNTGNRFTVTEMYVRIFRFCMKQHKNVEDLDKYITDNNRYIMNLALASYQAMIAKKLNLTNLDHEDNAVQNAFLTKQSWDPSTNSFRVYAFLHNTMQEFWAALFLILNPVMIANLLEKCHSDEDRKYLKYIIPFLSGLLSDNVVDLIKCLVPVEQIHAIHAKYFQQIIDTFLYTKGKNQKEQYVEADNLLFVCRCLYEYQSPEACRLFLEKVQYEVGLQDEILDPHQCCVMSYMISQSGLKKIDLDLTDCKISDPELKLILGSLKHLKILRSTNSLQSQMWGVALEEEQFSDFDTLLSLFSFEMHLNVHETLNQKVFRRIGEVLKKKSSESVHLFLHVKDKRIARPLQKTLFESLPNIASIRIIPHHFQVAVETELYLQGAIHETKTGQRCVRKLLVVFSRNRRENFKELCNYLLKLHEDAKNEDVLPVLQPVFYALPPTWVVEPSASSVSLILQIMDAVNLKKPAELDFGTYALSELKLFLHCIPYITEIRFSAVHSQPKDIHNIVKTVADLFILASECGEKELRSLTTACSYPNFPFAEDSKTMQSGFFLNLFTQVKKSSLWKTTLPALKTILKAAPNVWTVDLQDLKETSVLFEVLKLQAVPKPVELRRWSCRRDKLKIFLNCLPYVTKLHCDEQFFQTVCEVFSTICNWDPKQITELLRCLRFCISLTEMLPSRLCKTVGKVYKLLDNKDGVSLSLLPQKISYHGCAHLFSNLKKLQTLRVNEIAVSKLARLVRSDNDMHSVTVEELSVVLSNSHLPESLLCQLFSSLASLLRFWKIHSLNLSEFSIEPRLLFCLLCHQGPLFIKFHKDTLKQTAEAVFDALDENLTQLFLEKIDGDLSPCDLSWDVSSYLIQVTKKKVTLDLSEDRFNLLKVSDLLAVLDTVCFKWISPRIVRAALKEIYQKRAGHLVVKLVKSSANLINLCMGDLDTVDCKALCFALHYSDGVKLHLLNCVIPNKEIGRIVKLMHRVSELRVDRKLLLGFIHASKDLEKQGLFLSALLLNALDHKLDFSCNSSIGSGGFGHESRDLLTLSHTDFTAVSSAIEKSTHYTDLILYDCETDDSSLEILFNILHKVNLHLGKKLLCQLLTLILNAPMAMSLKWASSLSKALGKELDLSGIALSYRTCESLQLVLDYTEELALLNLSHCQITDACLDLLLPHLYKIMTLDLTGNDITDKGVQRLHKTLEANSFSKTICLCNNHITEMGLLMEEERLETQMDGKRRCAQPQNYITEDLGSKNRMEKNVFVKSEVPIKFEPEQTVNNGKIAYSFQWQTEGLFMCSATGLVFGMKGSGCVEYSVVHWDVDLLINTHYVPAGPLFDIKTPRGEIYELHLAHCETHVDAIGNLSVVHIHSNNTREFLSPIKISKTHIAVNICGLSKYGIVHENNQENTIIRGQVLLFHEPDLSPTQQRLWVFLLPANVPLLEIQLQQQKYVFIQTSSDCKLKINAKYSLISGQAIRVQPKGKLFDTLHAGNHHPTFEVFLDRDVTELQIKIQLKKKESNKSVWRRWIYLKQNRDDNKQIGSGGLSEENWKSHLGEIMEDLKEDEFKKLKHLMNNTGNRKSIPSTNLEASDRCELVNLIVKTWGFRESVRAMQEFMKKLPRNDEFVTNLLKPYVKRFEH